MRTYSIAQSPNSFASLDNQLFAFLSPTHQFFPFLFCRLSRNQYLCDVIFNILLNMQSHPTGVRGLKQW